MLPKIIAKNDAMIDKGTRNTSSTKSDSSLVKNLVAAMLTNHAPKTR